VFDTRFGFVDDNVFIQVEQIVLIVYVFRGLVTVLYDVIAGIFTLR